MANKVSYLVTVDVSVHFICFIQNFDYYVQQVFLPKKKGLQIPFVGSPPIISPPEYKPVGLY